MFPLICNRNQICPSTPKSILRECIVDLTTQLTELREFTTLEKQLTCEGNHCCKHVSAINIYMPMP